MHIKPNESSILAVKLFMKYFTPFFDVNITYSKLLGLIGLIILDVDIIG